MRDKDTLILEEAYMKQIVNDNAFDGLISRVNNLIPEKEVAEVIKEMLNEAYRLGLYRGKGKRI